MRNIMKLFAAKLRSRRGFTMVETLLYLGILIILITVLTQVFVALIDVQLETQTASPVEQDGGVALSRIEYDVSRASSITSPDLGFTSNTLEVVVDGVTYNYSILNGDLILTDSQGSDSLNSTESVFSNFTVTRSGNANGKNLIDVSFRVMGVAQKTKGPEIRDFSTTVGLR